MTGLDPTVVSPAAKLVLGRFWGPFRRGKRQTFDRTPASRSRGLVRADPEAVMLNGGLLEYAQQMAAHESTRTTKLYDRRNDQVTLDQVADCSLIPRDIPSKLAVPRF